MSEHFDVCERCPACDSASQETLFTRSYAEPALRDTLEGFYSEAFRRDYHWMLEAEYTLQRCGECGLIFQRHVPDAFLLGKLYEEWIDAAKAHARLRAGPLPAKPLATAHHVFLGLSLVQSSHRPLQTLDYGCGWGEWAQMMRAFGVEAWGTEGSATRGEYCHRCGINVIDETELPDRGFDFINLDEVFEHLPRPRPMLAMLVTKLRAGGVVRISVPNGRNVAKHLRHFERELRRPRGGGLYPVAPLQHLTCFTNASLTRLAAECGLVRIKPSWRVLLRAAHFPAGLKPKIRELIRPLYLRSSFCTELYFVARTDDGRQ